MVYCLIDDGLAGRRLRQRGPNPIMADSEVLTIECVGEFWGIDTDKGLYERFRRYWGPHVMTCLRNLVIGTLSRAGPVNLTAALRFHSRTHHRPPAILGISLG
jgi:hypothetical protein